MPSAPNQMDGMMNLPHLSSSATGTRLAMAAMLMLAATGGLSACRQDAAKPPAAAAEQIAWREGDVDDALSEAKESGKPVLLYWGAKWCPPCNQLKSTLFKDPTFVAQTRNFVPVYLDGDSEGAQRWGERFGISGYPTVIVLRGDGSEITRVSSGATVAKVSDVLRLAALRTGSIETLLDTAQKDPAALSADDRLLLSGFDWQNDPRHFSDHAHASALLTRLADAAPEPALRRRFALLALASGVTPSAEGKYALTPAQRASLVQVLPAVLANPEDVTANRQELSYSVPHLVASLPDAAQRTALGQSLVTALDKVHADAALPIPDRLGTVAADLALDKDAQGKVSPATLAKVQARAAWADGAAKDAMVRQSVISNAADLLHEAGDDKGAKALLTAELKRSASPYYYMLSLASLAEESGDAKGAIEWARKAYESAQGPATRVQWALEYSKVVLRQAPADKAAVEASANAVLDELASNPGSYYQRTRVKVAAWGDLMREWSRSHGAAATFARIEAKMAKVCASQPPEQAQCTRWGHPA